MSLLIIYGKSGSGKSQYCFSEISKLIENTLEQEPIDLTNFEEEQEKDAIISYD